MSLSNHYAKAGVDIDAGQRAVNMMKQAIQATYTPEVLSDTGNFGGLFSAQGLQQLDQPILVASTDGVGTKTKVAVQLDRWDTIGHDIVNHCVNDILVQGARPLFFLDYVASSKLESEKIATIVQGIAAACQNVGCALLGGETAEMPGVYQSGEIDLVGTVVGVVEQRRLLNGQAIQAGDVILGLASSGLHTNGYSLARNVLGDFDWNEEHTELGATLGEILLQPHRSYLGQIKTLWQAGVDIRGLAHITGGGIVDNLPRILPEGIGATIQRGTWPELPIFNLIQQHGQIETSEMFRVFNMGVGMLIVVPSEHIELATESLNEELYMMGEITTSGQVVIEGLDA